jgi:hypothetical protein
MAIKRIKNNSCGAKVNLKLLDQAGKAKQENGPPTRGKIRKDK